MHSLQTRDPAIQQNVGILEHVRRNAVVPPGKVSSQNAVLIKKCSLMLQMQHTPKEGITTKYTHFVFTGYLQGVRIIIPVVMKKRKLSEMNMYV